MLALAHHWQGLIRSGAVRDQAELARLVGVSRARVSRVMRLLDLAAAMLSGNRARTARGWPGAPGEGRVSSTRTLILAFLLLAAALAGGIVYFQSSDPEPAPGAESVEPEPGAPPPQREDTLPARLQGAHATDAEESASAAAAPLPTESDLAPGDVLVRGRLLTPDGKPPRGGSVELVHGDSVLARRAASVDGTFAIVVRAAEVPASADTGLRATDTAGHEAALQVQFGRMAPRGGPPQEPGRVVDVGVVRLLPLHALEIQVRFPSGATPPALVQAGATGMLPTGIGPFLPLASTHRTDAEGRLRLDLPEGTARILAVAEGSGRQVAWVTMPREQSDPLVIELPPERLVTVEVVDGASGAPVPDAEVTASEMVQAPGASYVTSAAWWPPLDPSHTDANGRLVMRGIGTDQRVWVVANAEGYPIAAGIPPRFQTVRIEPGATSVRIEMAPARTVRWPIEEGPVPAPGEGSAIVIRPAPGTYLADVQIPTQGRVESADLVVSGWPPGYLHGLAVAPDGSMARLGAKEGEDVGYPITFFPSRRIDVLVRYPDGEPAQGWFVNLRNQGNNPLAPPAPTGPDGRAVIEGLYGGPHGLVQVHVSDRNEAWSGTPAGTVDLARGDGSLEATVERTRDAVLRFTLGGAPHLPPDPRISVGTTYAASPERDEEAGEVHFPWRPQPGRAQAPLHVEADGFLPVSRQVDVPAPDEPLVEEIALEPAGSFVVRVTLPEDGQVRVAVQAWKPETSTWESLWLPMTRMGGYAQPDANGIIRFTPLAAGRYRGLETLAGVASPIVDVKPGASPPEVALDLGRAGYAKGRVVVPEGRDLRRSHGTRGRRRGLRELAGRPKPRHHDDAPEGRDLHGARPGRSRGGAPRRSADAPPPCDRGDRARLPAPRRHRAPPRARQHGVRFVRSAARGGRTLCPVARAGSDARRVSLCGQGRGQTAPADDRAPRKRGA